MMQCAAGWFIASDVTGVSQEESWVDRSATSAEPAFFGQVAAIAEPAPTLPRQAASGYPLISASAYPQGFYCSVETETRVRSYHY